MVDPLIVRAVGVIFEHGNEPVGDGAEAWIIEIPVGGFDKIGVHLNDSRVLELLAR